MADQLPEEAPIHDEVEMEERGNVAVRL